MGLTEHSTPASVALSEGAASWSMMASAKTGAAPSTRATMYPAQLNSQSEHATIWPAHRGKQSGSEWVSPRGHRHKQVLPSNTQSCLLWVPMLVECLHSSTGNMRVTSIGQMVHQISACLRLHDCLSGPDMWGM